MAFKMFDEFSYRKVDKSQQYKILEGVYNGFIVTYLTTLSYDGDIDGFAFKVVDTHRTISIVDNIMMEIEDEPMEQQDIDTKKIEELENEVNELESMLRRAYEQLGDTHQGDTDLYNEIRVYFDGPDDEEEE